MEELSTSTQQEINLLLALLAKADNIEARNQLWNLNQRFITKMVLEYYNNHSAAVRRHGYTLDDLMQESYFAFLKAVKRYDPAKGAFTTALGSSIGWHLWRLMIAGGSICVRDSNCSGEQRVSSNALDHSSSLNEPCVGLDGSECELEELLPDPGGQIAFENIIDGIYQKELHAAIEKALSRLPERSATVVRERWFNDKTFTQIGSDLGVSTERIRVIHNDAFRALQTDSLLRQYAKDVFLQKCYDKSGLSVWKQRGSVQERAVEFYEKHDLRMPK